MALQEGIKVELVCFDYERRSGVRMSSEEFGLNRMAWTKIKSNSRKIKEKGSCAREECFHGIEGRRFPDQGGFTYDGQSAAATRAKPKC
jgi:hypothetical protein